MVPRSQAYRSTLKPLADLSARHISGSVRVRASSDHMGAKNGDGIVHEIEIAEIGMKSHETRD